MIVPKLTLTPSYRSKPISITKRRWDPATAIFSSLIGTSVNIANGATGVLLEPGRELARERQKSQSQEMSTTDGAKENATDADDGSGDSTMGTAQSMNSSEQEATLAASNGSPRSNYAAAGTLARSSGKAAGKVISSAFKGVLVDLPLATAEGFRFMPRMWGSEVKQYGDVTDWQSGTLVAGKTVVYGVGEGVRDVVTNTIDGARSEGMIGAAKGLGSGMGSLVSGTLSAGVGVVAYPGQRIAKSLHAAMHGSTAKRVADARHAAGKWSAERLTKEDELAVVNAYYRHKG